MEEKGGRKKERRKQLKEERHATKTCTKLETATMTVIRKIHDRNDVYVGNIMCV